MKDKQVNKLMVIVRKDIPNGLMIAQAVIPIQLKRANGRLNELMN